MSPDRTRVLPPSDEGGQMNRRLSTVQHVRRQLYPAGVLRRAITALVCFAWISSSLACPLPTLPNDGLPQVTHAFGPETLGHEHRYAHGSRGHDHQSDLCCDILGHSYSAAESANSPQKYATAPDRAPVPPIVSFLVAATPTDETINPQWHGPEPPPRPWPRFTKVWSQAPPAKHN